MCDCTRATRNDLRKFCGNTLNFVASLLNATPQRLYYLVRRDLHILEIDQRKSSDDHGEKNEIGRTLSKILSRSSAEKHTKTLYGNDYNIIITTHDKNAFMKCQAVCTTVK